MKILKKIIKNLIKDFHDTWTGKTVPYYLSNFYIKIKLKSSLLSSIFIKFAVIFLALLQLLKFTVLGIISIYPPYFLFKYRNNLKNWYDYDIIWVLLISLPIIIYLGVDLYEKVYHK